MLGFPPPLEIPGAREQGLGLGAPKPKPWDVPLILAVLRV